jgi:hypothetical protein
MKTRSVDEMVLEAERRVRAKGALPSRNLFSGLGAGPQGSAAARRLLKALEARGLERTATGGARVPIAEQLSALVLHGARHPVDRLPLLVSGATRSEIKQALQQLVEAGLVNVVARDGQDVLVGANEDVLEEGEIEALAELGAALKRCHARGVRVLREDVARFAGQERRGRSPRQPSGEAEVDGATSSASRRRTPKGPLVVPASDRVLKTMRDLETELGLVRIPEVVRALQPSMPIETIHEAIMALADAGEIELHPDAGTEFLPLADQKLCPPGPRETVLSSARLLR